MTNSQEKPTILIIAGGENSRFAPLNTKTHKGFLTLAGKPIVARAFEDLKKHGFENVVLVLSPKDYNGGFSKVLEENNFGLNITTVLQEKAKGMGDALLLAKNYLSEHFILASPYYNNVGHIAEQLWIKQKESGANCVYSGTQTTTPELYGMLKFDASEKEKVVGVIEKPKPGSEPSDIKIDSIYLFDSGFITELTKTEQAEYSLEDAITAYAQTQYSTWIQNTTHLQSLKYPWHLFRLLDTVFSTQKTSLSKTAEIAQTAQIDDSHGPVIIADGAVIGDFVKISGPCYIGSNCLIGDYSFVRGSSLESGSVVGANTEVVRSILFENASIHYGYLADSIIGHGTKIGAGLITANKRLDRANVRVQVKGTLIDTGTNALGIITGEGATLGIRVSTMPGLLVGAHASVHPNTTIKRNIQEKTTTK